MGYTAPPASSPRWWVALAALVLPVAAVAGLALPASALSAQSPEGAIAAVVQADGRQYAGLCEQTRSPEDIGKVCSKLIDQRNGVQAHLIGRTFSEFASWVFVAPRDGGWTVAATAPLDFHDVSGAVPWPR